MAIGSDKPAITRLMSDRQQLSDAQEYTQGATGDRPHRVDRIVQRFVESIDGANRRPRLWLAILAGLFAIQISPWFYPTGDGSLYLSTVREFLTTEDIANFHCFVPPGYPLLILPTFLTGNRPFLALSILNWILAVIFLVETYRWARRQFPSVAVLLTGVVAANITLWTYYRRPLKEMAFMAILMSSVNLLHATLRPQPLRASLLPAGGAGLLLTMLSLIRFPGLTVAIGFSIALGILAWRRDFRWTHAISLACVVGILPTAAVGSWLIYDRYYVGGAVYWQEIVSVYTEDFEAGAQTRKTAKDMIDAGSDLSWMRFLPWGDSHFMRSTVPRFLSGFQYRLTDLGCMSVPGLWKAVPDPHKSLDIWRIVYLGFFLVMLVGWWRLARKKVDVLILTAPVYFLLYVHWVCDQPGGRFMLPMLPAIIACAWYGLGPRRNYRVCLFGLLLLLHLGQSGAYWLMIDAPRAAHMEHQWPLADRFAATIQRAPSVVGIKNLPLEVFLALNLTLDNRTRPQLVTEPIDPSICWVVVPDDETRSLAGFDVFDSSAGYSLLHRRSETKTLTAATSENDPQKQLASGISPPNPPIR